MQCNADACTTVEKIIQKTLENFLNKSNKYRGRQKKNKIPPSKKKKKTYYMRERKWMKKRKEIFLLTAKKFNVLFSSVGADKARAQGEKKISRENSRDVYTYITRSWGSRASTGLKTEERKKAGATFTMEKTKLSSVKGCGWKGGD